MAISAELRTKIEAFALQGVAYFRGALIRLDKVATRETLQSFESRVVYRRRAVLLQYWAVDTFTFRIEGRKAGTPPPLAPLEDWIEAKRLDISPYALQQAIGQDGTSTPPVPFFPEMESRLLPQLGNFLESDEVAFLLFRRMDNLFNQ